MILGPAGSTEVGEVRVVGQVEGPEVLLLPQLLQQLPLPVSP